MVQIGSYSKMTYLIKHPITRKMPKFALVYRNANYTFPTGGARSDNFQLDTIIQSDGMGLSISSNAVILQQKKYYVECRASIIYASSYVATTDIKVNGSNVQASVQAKTGSYLDFTPVNIASAIIDANAGDLLTFLHTRSTSVASSPSVQALYNKFLIMEIV